MLGRRTGAYVAVGSQLTSLVPERKWIIANFRETQVAGMKVGQIAEIGVDTPAHARILGHIACFSPAAGSEFAVIKTADASGNFTKVVQRIPVRIEIDAGQDLAGRLVPSMSVAVTVDTAATLRSEVAFH